MGSELAALAARQLRAWELRAREWPMRIAAKENGTHLICAVCEQTLLPLTYLEKPYTFVGNTTLAATVAHLRNVHRWVEEEVYSNGDGSKQDAETNPSAGDPGASHLRVASAD